MTFDSFDQSDENTWPGQENTYLPSYLFTYLPTYLPTCLLYKTPSRSNPRDLWPLIHLIRVMRRHDLTTKYHPTEIPTHLPTYPPTYLPYSTPSRSNPGDLWPLRHWFQVWKLRAWLHDNLCYLTLKSDTGQHLQFLRCFVGFVQF